jgi:hypothetical protein
MNQRIDPIGNDPNNGGTMHAVVLVLVLGLPVLLIGLIVLLVTAGRSAPPQDQGATVVAARRHETRISTAAGAASLCVALALGGPVATGRFPSGVLLGLSPFAAVLMFCVVRTVGEARWPRPTGDVRSAPLVRRSLRDQGGWRLPVFLGTAGALGVALVVFGLTAGEDGYSVDRTTPNAGGPGLEVLSAGPYPGWEAGVPALLALLLAVGATLVALRAVTRRPPIGLLSPAQDGALRRTSAAQVLAGAQLWVGLGATGYLAFAAGALFRVGWTVGGLACLLLALVAFAGSVVLAASAALAQRADIGAGVPRTVASGSAT